MATVHASPSTKSASGSSVNVRGPPLTTAVCIPLLVQEISNHEPVTETSSLNITVTSVSRATCVASLAGVVSVTVGASLAHDRVGTEPVERVGGEPVPLDGGVEGVVRIGVARLDGRLAAQRVVRRAREAGAPFGARVDAALPDRVDDRGALEEHHGVVAVEPAARRSSGRPGRGLPGRPRSARRRRRRRPPRSRSGRS